MNEIIKEIEIVKSLDEGDWYSKCIGRKFNVIERPWWANFHNTDDCYYVEHPENDEDTALYVLISDCKVTESVAQSANKATEQPSKAAAVEGLILTEEELKERNRLLVLENDDLLAIHTKEKKELLDIIQGFLIWEEMFPTKKTYNKTNPALVDDDYEAYRKLVDDAKIKVKVLEELK